MRHFGHMFCGVYARVRHGGHLRSGVALQTGGPVAQESLRRAATQETAPPLSDWPRPARVARIEDEEEGIRSLYLFDTMARHGAWSSYAPGQHVRLHGLNGTGCWRAYTVSAWDEASATLRVTVKRDRGTGSTALHAFAVGDPVTITGPFGALVVPVDAGSVLFLTAGIGITPAVAMLPALAGRPARFVHTSRSGTPALWHEIERFAAKHDHVEAELYVTGSGADRRPDLNRIAASAVERRGIVVVCGPASFNQTALEALTHAGVPNERISTETFVPSDVAVGLRAPPRSGPFAVRFARSDVRANWADQVGTLLDLAEQSGLTPPSHCRAGVCGSCRVNVLHWRVVDLRTGAEFAKGSVLACCAAPLSEATLEL